MNLEKYKEKLNQLLQDYNNKKAKIDEEYVFSNNPYSVGDIVKDHIGSVLIEKIKCSYVYTGHVPECVYFGLELKKDLTPRKDGSKRNVYQSNIKIVK